MSANRARRSDVRIFIACGVFTLYEARSRSFGTTFLKSEFKKANVFYFRSTLPFEMGNFLKLKHEQNGFFGTVCRAE